MAFCTGNIPSSFTNQELQASFGNGITQSILPTTQQQRNDNGLLTKDATSRIVEDLFRSGKITKTNIPSASIKAEYCFYDTRYKYALKNIVEKISRGINKNNTVEQTAVKVDLEILQGLNQKLSDITLITAAIAEKLRKESSGGSDIEIVSSELNKKAAILKKQGEIINSHEGPSNLYKEMMRFSREKVRATDNLLSLYSFLNIFALGMLVYIYMSM
jgi:hypothetical protein